MIALYVIIYHWNNLFCLLEIDIIYFLTTPDTHGFTKIIINGKILNKIFNLLVN